GELARDLVAEVRIVLVARGQAGREAVGEVAFQAQVDGVVVALGVHRVLGGEAAEALRAAAGVRARLARRLVPLLLAVFGAERQRDRIGQAPVQQLREV